MTFSVQSGMIPAAKKVVIYGPEGIGKSTFAAQFPQPLFIDTEGSTNFMSVSRLPSPTGWEMLLDEVRYVRDNPTLCRTLVVDTIDWAERMCVEGVCQKHNVSGIESFGYGKGYTYVKEEFARGLKLLSEVVSSGVNVVLTAHAQLRKFEQPDEMGAYDRWELKLGSKSGSQTSPLVKEWSDLLLFANYKIMTVATDNTGKKVKAQGGRRVMYTAHHPCWDAKNRFGLPDECEFDYRAIAPIIEQQPAPSTPTPPAAEPKPSQGGKETAPAKPAKSSPAATPIELLRKRMERDGVTAQELEAYVEEKGFLGKGMKLEQYPEDFVRQMVRQWKTILSRIHSARAKKIDLSEYEEVSTEGTDDLPF